MTPSELLVSVVEGTAPNVVQDLNGDGKFDNKDLTLMGHKVISKTTKSGPRQPTERDHRKSDGFINQRQAPGTAK